MATMQDVADRAGVALSTVSVALNGTRPVAAATRRRIEQAMEELSYQRNALARGLASRRSHILALTYPVAENGMSRTAMEFVQSAAEAARDHGYHLVLWPFAATDSAELLDLAGQGLVDGVLVMEVYLEDARVEALRSARLPVALIGRTSAAEPLPGVDIDFDRTLDEAVEYLVVLGHREISFLNHAPERRAQGHGPTVRAEVAYEAAMRARGLVPDARCAGESVTGGRTAVRELLAARPGTTGLITMNEEATFGVVAELVTTGRVIPDDVSVLSVVSSPAVGEQTVPPLTTMHAPGAELGRRGVDTLLALVEHGSAPDQALASCLLVEGGSTGPVPGRHT
ncbi:LacI family DNA-binding transcriptional regulator [Cellulomonas hominis]